MHIFTLWVTYGVISPKIQTENPDIQTKEKLNSAAGPGLTTQQNRAVVGNLVSEKQKPAADNALNIRLKSN